MQSKISPFSSLQFRDYRLFFWGSLVSEVGTQMQVVGINWQIYEITNSAWALGLVGLAGFLPIIVFALLGGLTADLMDRKKLLIITQIIQGILAVVLAVTTITGTISPLMIYLMIALASAAKTFQAPARQAIIPHLVPQAHFINAVSLNTLIRQSSILIGPAIAGFMIALYGVDSIYIFNALSYLLLIIALIPIQVNIKPLEKKVTYSFRSIMEGIKFVAKNPILSSTMLLDFLANFFSSATTLLPIFAKDILGVGAQGLGVLYAAPALGAVIAGLVMASLGNIANQGKAILISVFVFGAATIGFGLSRNFYLSIFFLCLLGVGDMISTVLRNTIRQLITPDYIRGRMVSINMIFVQGGPLIGEAEAGFVAALIGAPLSVVTGGIATIFITGVIYIKAKKLRSYQGHEAAI